MPSQDSFHKKHPKANGWMGESVPTGASAQGRKMSGQILRLAERTEQDPDELAKRISADTVRRTKYPVIEQRDAEGRRLFKHDTGIRDDGRTASR